MLDNSAESLWEVEHINPKIRFECYGEPVKANDSILLKHSFTNQWLSTDKCFSSLA